MPLRKGRWAAYIKLEQNNSETMEALLSSDVVQRNTSLDKLLTDMGIASFPDLVKTTKKLTTNICSRIAILVINKYQKERDKGIYKYT